MYDIQNKKLANLRGVIFSNAPIIPSTTHPNYSKFTYSMLVDSSTLKPNSGAVLLAVLITLVFQQLPPTCSSSERRWDRTKQQNYKAMNEFFLRNGKMPLDRISGGNGTSRNDTTDNTKPDEKTGVTNPAKNTKSITLTIVAIVAASLLVVVLVRSILIFRTNEISKLEFRRS